MKQREHFYVAFKDDDKRLKALISRDLRLILVAGLAVSCAVSKEAFAIIKLLMSW